MKLSRREIRGIKARLRKRYARKIGTKLVAVGIGPAISGDQPDPERPLAAQFLVEKKRKRAPRDQRVPAEVTVYIRRRGRRRRVVLPTDVIEVGGFMASGARLRTTGAGTVTGGTVIRWGAPGDRHYGIVTVGHAFQSDGERVRITAPNGAEFDGMVVALSSEGSAVDAAIVEVDRTDLASNGLVPAPNAAPRVTRPVAALEADVQAGYRGHSLRPGGDVELLPIDFEEGPVEFPGLPPVRDALLAMTVGAGSGFEPGTSGSVWTISPSMSSPLPAAMQFAGRRPEFSKGLGQASETVLLWAEIQVGSPGFKFVEIF